MLLDALSNSKLSSTGLHQHIQQGGGINVGINDNFINTFDKTVIEQERVKGTFDQRKRDVKFGIGDIVLLWDKLKKKPGKHGKLEKIWMGPCQVSSIAEKGLVYLETLDGDEFELPVNGILLKHYFPPIA